MRKHLSKYTPKYQRELFKKTYGRYPTDGTKELKQFLVNYPMSEISQITLTREKNNDKE